MKKILTIIFVFLLSACQPKASEKPKMNQSKNSIKAYCVGRQIINIPVSFSPSPIITGIFKSKDAKTEDPTFDLTVYADMVTSTQFQAAVDKRRAELRTSEGGTINIMKLDKSISSDATLFRVQEIDDAYFSELYVLRGTAMVKLRLESFDNSYLEAENRIIRIAGGISENNTSTSQNKVGFCLGPVNIYSDLSHEFASFVFRDSSGLKIGIDIDTYGRNDPVSLLLRMSGVRSLLNKFNVRHEMLRGRERNVIGMKADEWLGVGYIGDAANQRTLKFMLETKRENPGKSTPNITLSLDSAQPLKDGAASITTISNDEALSMWDQIVDSIKLVPDAG